MTHLPLTTLDPPGPENAELLRHYSQLRSYARSLTKNPADADDLVQETVLRAMLKFELFRPGTNFGAWLRTMMKNVFLDSLKRAHRRRKFEDAYIGTSTAWKVPPNQVSRLELDAVDRGLDSLPAEQRKSLIMVALDGIDYERTAAATGVPVGTVRSRVSRARSSLIAISEGKPIGELSRENRLAKTARPGAHRPSSTKQPCPVSPSIRNLSGDCSPDQLSARGA